MDRHFFKTTAPDGKEGSLTLAFGGTRLAPYWRVTAIRGGIGTFSVDPDFAAIEGLAPGCKVTVKFGTWLSEIEDTDETGGARANLGIDKLRFLLRMASDLTFLDRRRYEHAARSLDEIGRLIWG